MSNRLEAKERIDTVRGVDAPEPIDRYQIVRRAEQLRAETLARLVSALWRWIRTPGSRYDAALHELDDHTLADIGLRRNQVPGFVAREIEAARDVAYRTRDFRTPAAAG